MCYRVDFETQQVCTGGKRSVWVDGPPRTQALCNQLNDKWNADCGHLPEVHKRAKLYLYFNQEHQCLNIGKDKVCTISLSIRYDSKVAQKWRKYSAMQQFCAILESYLTRPRLFKYRVFHNNRPKVTAYSS